MDIQQAITELRNRALTKHRSVAAWLKAAKVAPSTYYAWVKPRAGRISMPSTRTLARLELAAEA